MREAVRYQDVMSPLNHGPVSSNSEGPGMELDSKTLRRCGNLFRAMLFQRQAITCYWVPSRAHFTTRRRYENVEPARRLPSDAIEFGTYQYPCHERNFLEDLQFCVAPLPQPEQVPAPRPERLEAAKVRRSHSLPKLPRPLQSFMHRSAATIPGSQHAPGGRGTSGSHGNEFVHP